MLTTILSFAEAAEGAAVNRSPFPGERSSGGEPTHSAKHA
jgi:hypothetical protein